MSVQTLMPATTITTAVTGVATEPFSFQPHGSATFTAIFDYGSGGTTAKAWVQTSLDGTTWTDVANFAFTTADATRIHKITEDATVAANYTPTDGTLADNTIKDGLLGDRYRVKYTTTGTYAGATTLTILMHTQG